MKRRGNGISLNFCIICLLILIIVLMIIYIIGQKTNNQNQTSIYTTQPDVVTTALEYDYYNFLPRRLFRNFYENDYYDYNRPVVIQQDTKPIYINVPSQSHSSQPSQQNNLNLFNYPPPKPEQKFETNTPPAPTISPPPLSGVSPSSLSSENI